MRIEFMVYGIPKPGGSKTVFFGKKTGKPIVVDSCKRNKQWRDSVIAAAVAVYQGPPLTGPLHVSIEFFMPRPKDHYKTGKNAGVLKDKAPIWHTVKPDRTKLLRSTEDALSRILWRDDAQIVTGNVMKLYTNKTPGAKMIIEEMEVS